MLKLGTKDPRFQETVERSEACRVFHVAKATASAAAVMETGEAGNDGMCSRKVESLARAACDKVKSVTQGNPDRMNYQQRDSMNSGAVNNEVKYQE